MCVYICIMNLQVRVWEHVFSCFLVILVFTMTTSLCLYPILSFNRVYWLYLNPPRARLLYRYKTVLSHGLLKGVVNWYMYVYMYCWERQTCNLNLWFSIFGEKWLGHDFLNFYSFVSYYLWKWHVIFMHYIYGIEESGVSWENLCYIIWYLKRNNCIVKTLFIACLLLQGRMTTPWSHLITIFCTHFLRTFI